MQLVLLNVSNNRLKSLPESVGSCASLEEIQANGMFLVSFSKTPSPVEFALWLLFLLESLIVIWDSLADNVIEELPASLCNLIQLKSLCLDNNQVKQVEQLKRD